MAEKNSNLWLFIVGALIIGVLAGGGTTFLLLKTNKVSDTLDVQSILPVKANNSVSDWLVKIDDYIITKSEFEDGFQYYMTQIPDSQRANLPSESVIKRQFLDNLIAQYVINLKAINEGIPASKEGQFLLKAALRQAIYSIYLQKSIPQDKSAFTPTKIELDQIYKQYEQQFNQRGWNADQRKQYMNQVVAPQLSQQKLQNWVSEFVGIAKENYKIKRNEELILKEGITSGQQSPLLLQPQQTNK